MHVRAEDEETYCIRTQTHVPFVDGANIVCYRCGMMMGHAASPKLGSLLDY